MAMVLFLAGCVFSLEFNYTVSSPVNTNWRIQPDISPAICWYNNSIYLAYSPQGSMGQAMVYKGTTMDDMVEQTTAWGGVCGGIQGSWMNGLWIDPETGYWYMAVHIEFNYNVAALCGKNHFRRIGVARSTDNGRSFVCLGDIITSDNSTRSRDDYPNSYVNFGWGDNTMYVDTRGGYIYIFGETGWLGCLGSRTTVRAARCAIADKMAPGKWYKYYNGKWDQPALGGHASDLGGLIHNPGYGWAVSYNTYLQRYIGIGSNGYISTCTDLSKQDWDVSEKLPSGITQWYHFIADPAISSYEGAWITGKTFRFYSASDGRVAPGRYVTITLDTTSKRTPDMASRGYPALPVTDYNACYDPNYPGILDIACPNLTWTGTWQNSRDPRDVYGTVNSATDSAASVTMSFCGSEFSVYGRTGPSFGRLKIYVDNVLKSTAATSATAAAFKTQLAAITGLANNTRHQVTLRPYGDGPVSINYLYVPVVNNTPAPWNCSGVTDSRPAPAVRHITPSWHLVATAQGLSLRIRAAGPYKTDIFDASGNSLGSFCGNGPASHDVAVAPGVVFVKVRAGGAAVVERALVRR
jgi:hypothetical protein